jgi:two-component system, NarL family, sensor kinase
MNRIVHFIVFCMLGSHSFGQISFSLGGEQTEQTKILETELLNARSDSAKAMACFKLAMMHNAQNDSGNASVYLNKGIAISAGNSFLTAVSYYFRTIAENGSSSVSTLEKKYVVSDSLLSPFDNKTAWKIRGFIWQNYGILRQTQGNDNDAMDMFINKALPYALKSGENALIGKVYKSLGVVFMNLEQNEKAKTYLDESIVTIEKESVDNPYRLVELVESYNLAAENDLLLNYVALAKEKIEKAKKILSAYPRSNLYLSFYYAEGKYFEKINRYKDALESYNKGIAYGKLPVEIFFVNRMKFAKYESLFLSKQYNKAMVVLTDLMKEPAVFLIDQKMYFKEAFKTYEKLGNFSAGLTMAKKYIALSDSMYGSKFQTEIVELETKYKANENQQKIASLQIEKEKNQLNAKNNKLAIGLLGTISVFLLVASLLAWKNHKSNKKLLVQKEMNYQQELKEVDQQRRMQYASALLQGEEKERKRLAGDLHDGLGGMLAGVKMNLSRIVHNHAEAEMNAEFNNVIEQLDNSVTELRRIARNMMPESLMKLGLDTALKDMCSMMSNETVQIDFQSFSISSTMRMDKQVAVYRIVQELLANAMKHASAKHILVQCSQNDDTFFITVEDNGKGIDKESALASQGIGLMNVQNRVSFLNGVMDIHSTPFEGTSINIEFNVAA